MSLKTLLVHVDDGASCVGRIEAAIRLAVSCNARLVGVYLTPTPNLASTVASMLPESVVLNRLREEGDAQHAAERMFRDAAATLRCEHVAWRAPAGDPLQSGLSHARNADLFVLGQRDPREGGADFVEDLIATVLLGSGHPVVVIPYIGAPVTIGSNVLVATEGGREASRAIADALPILERAERVNVLIGVRDGHADEYELARERLAGWLGDHGVRCTIERFEAAPSIVGESLLSRASDLASDLIVMGGYGQARLRELMLGGTTRTILESMTVPVLLSH